MEFSPNNPVVKLCLQGMAMDDQGNPAEAAKLFLQAWDQASDDFEKFIAAHFVARHQNSLQDKLNWLKTALQHALIANEESVNGAYHTLYQNLADCYHEAGDSENAKKNYDLALSYRDRLTDKGPFYHGTKADLQVGDLLTPGGTSNYDPGITMNHIYFTALANGAGLAAELAKGSGPGHVYIVEPTGGFENDPNVTDKKFPGNLTRSYRSSSPLKIVGEIPGWTRQSPEQLGQWREKLADSRGEIIN